MSRKSILATTLLAVALLVGLIRPSHAGGRAAVFADVWATSPKGTHFVISTRAIDGNSQYNWLKIWIGKSQYQGKVTHIQATDENHALVEGQTKLANGDVLKLRVWFARTENGRVQVAYDMNMASTRGSHAVAASPMSWGQATLFAIRAGE